MSARGPTRLISPRTTLNSCGSSSRLVRRRNRPLRVMRGSSGEVAVRVVADLERLFDCDRRPAPSSGTCTSERRGRPCRRAGARTARGGPSRSRIQSAIRRKHGAEDDERRRGEHAVERVLDARGGRVPDERGHGRIIAAVRVAIVDPASTTPPYDHSLASALARRGHTVDLLTSPFPFGPVPEPVGYRRDELFLPVSGRILARNPRSRSRFVVKGLEYLPSVRRLLRRLRELEPDVVHVQWLALPRLDMRWLRRVAPSCRPCSPRITRCRATTARASTRARRVYDMVAARDRALAARRRRPRGARRRTRAHRVHPARGVRVRRRDGADAARPARRCSSSA